MGKNDKKDREKKLIWVPRSSAHPLLDGELKNCAYFVVCSTCRFYSSFDMKDESREENWPNVKVSPPCIHHAQLELNSTFNCSLCV